MRWSLRPPRLPQRTLFSSHPSVPARCGRRMMSDKIKPHHQARKAILYSVA